MRQSNDVAGLLFGDHASLLITKVFVDRKLSPDYASVGFLVAGILGAALQVLDGGWAFAGALFLVLYYVLDCVDGEVARWQNVVAIKWSYYDYLFHLLIKPLAFLGIGLGAAWSTQRPMLLVAAFCAAVATLWLKALKEIPGILFLREALERGRVLTGPAVQPAPAAAASFELRWDLVTLRALLTNFDVGLLFLVGACAVDAFLPAAGAPLGLSWRAVWLLYYGAVLPLDFLDHLWTDLRAGRCQQQMARLQGLAQRNAELPALEPQEPVAAGGGGRNERRRKS